MMNCAGIRLIVCVWLLIRRTKHNKHSICGWESMLFVYLSIRATETDIAAANAICGVTDVASLPIA